MLSENTEPIDTSAAVEPPVEDIQNPQPQIDANGNYIYPEDTPTPDPEPEDPRDRELFEKGDPQRHKRNCGRTGPTSNAGLAVAARNATRHGMCARTLILVQESEEDWKMLLNCFLRSYNNPAEDTMLYTFVLKTAQAEWFRLRAVREYDYMFQWMDNQPLPSWHADKEKEHALVLRYLTAAERRFQREYRMLEHHFKTHHRAEWDAKQAESKAKVKAKAEAEAAKPPQPEPPPEDDDPTKIFFVHSQTGERRDAQGNKYPPRPDFKPQPIIPGQFPPNHPANWNPHEGKGVPKRPR